jgi:hypothetical protein
MFSRRLFHRIVCCNKTAEISRPAHVIFEETAARMAYLGMFSMYEYNQGYEELFRTPSHYIVQSFSLIPLASVEAQLLLNHLLS